MSLTPFAPGQGSGNNLTINPNNSSASATFGTAAIGMNNVLVKNSGSTVAFIRFTVGSSTATANDFSLLPGEINLLSKGLADTASVYSTGNVTVYVSAGGGQ